MPQAPLPPEFPDPETPIVGDGILTIPESESDEMKDCTGACMDLPCNVGSLLITESTGNIQANNRDGRNIGTIAMGVLQVAAARNFDELGTVEGRANSGVNATPIASPATQTGG